MSQTSYVRLEYPKTCAPDDFWGQVKRTVNGEPPPQEQIGLIFGMTRRALDFSESDILLDIGCGNGRLCFEFFGEVKEYRGVDISPVLIEIARKNFERIPSHVFQLQGAAEYCETESRPERFTKALCYGAFACFSETEVKRMLSFLRSRFTGLEKLFIGNIPDRGRADNFFYPSIPPQERSLDDHTSALGRWYSRNEVLDLARRNGWEARICDPPRQYYQAHYRFNAILRPKRQ
jgi:SAM-dependent methyltransferase